MTETIMKSITIDAPPNKVFRAITDEKELTNWFPNIARLEPKVGGLVEFKFQRADGEVDHTIVGKVLEIVPDKKFSMSWKNTFDPSFPDTVVTWTLEPAGSKTKVKLVHTGFEKDRWLELHDGGWSYFVGRLAEYCQTGHVENKQIFKEIGGSEGDKDDLEIRKTLVIDVEPEVVFKALTDEQELTRWFPNQAILDARVGGRMEFRFHRPDTGENHTMEGKVLEMVPSKKLSYSWKTDYVPDFPDTIVTWTLEPVGKNKTKVTLVHSGLKGKITEEYDKGWSYFVSRLEQHCKKK